MKSMKSGVLVLGILSAYAVTQNALARPPFGGGPFGQQGGDFAINVLERLDENADGVVSLDEFTTQRTARAERRFDNIDRDDDGFISADEYSANPGRGLMGRRRNLTEIDEEAFRQCMQDQLGPSYEGPPTWEEMLSRYDSNGDGLIDRSEFLAAQTQKASDRFAEIDTNDDGQLSQEELEAAQAQAQELRTIRYTCVMQQRELNGVLE